MAGAMTSPSPFHRGEREVQSRLGVREVEAWARKVVRPCLPDQHRAFHTALPFLVAAARDARGQPWATLLTGRPGFVTSPDARTLLIDARPVPGDALEGALTQGAPLGLLGIEFATRRRNRVNGRVADSGSGGIRFTVDQTFGNCPQYIREREWHLNEAEAPKAPRRGRSLTASQRRWIQSADTFFIASGHPGNEDDPRAGMDASHRGGEPGFVEVRGERRLVFPDYAGNNHFNTLGNLILDPRAGLAFVDFETGSLLQLAVRTRIDWDSPEVARFPGARRLVHCEIQAVVELPRGLPLRWSADPGALRPLRVVEKIPESADVTSFYFAPADGRALAQFKPGQHLPIELDIPGREAPVERTYSLSNAPGTDCYRISVKREPRGLASRHLHDHLQVGAVLQARRPTGDFVLGCTDCPVVLISAGVGLTPLASMLLAFGRTPLRGPVWFIHGARDGRHHPLAREVRDAAARHPAIHTHVAYSRPGPDDRLGVHYDSRGRLDAERVARLYPALDAEYYLCGPPGFMAELQSGLEQRGVPAERIHTESFGPAA